jgi:hypothetical protein
MNDLQTMGGVAALIQAAAYVVGFGLALTFLLAPSWTRILTSTSLSSWTT